MSEGYDDLFNEKEIEQLKSDTRDAATQAEIARLRTELDQHRRIQRELARRQSDSDDTMWLLGAVGIATGLLF